ncbi:MAG: M42 family metallopeptidase [Chthonomonadales bacterium]|nr:M42 family metallopeptidase [Chthonomonadales bacterium]
MNFDLLKRLCETPGVSGREERIRAVVVEELRPLVSEVRVDVMGNVVATKRGAGGGPRVMVAAHMDQIGFLVKHIDDKGFLRLQPIGGWDPRNMVAQRVHVHGFAGETLLGALMPAAKPVHMLTPEEAGKAPRIEEMFVDLGLAGDEVRKRVEIGDMVTMARTAERVGGNVMSLALDNRIALFVTIEALRAVGSHACDIVAVATTQEEVGLRGATTAAYALEPEVGLAVDVTLANDFPGAADQDQVSRLGAGVAIKVMDSSLLCHPKLVRHFRDLAERHQIPYQLELLARGGTDAGGIQRSRGGVASFTLSVPCRYVHTVNETASVSDIEGAVQLLARYLEDAHTRSYGYADELGS